MADTNYVAGQQIPLAWIQDVNNAVYRGIGSSGVVPTTPAQTLANIGAAAQGGSAAIQFNVANATGATQATSLAQVQALIAASATTNTRIVIVTDSGAGATVLGEGWSAEFSNQLKQWGVGGYEVVTVAQPNGTFYRALNNTDMGGVTALAATIALAPVIVIVILGFNDANGSDGRTLAQIEGDAQSFISQVATALPSAKIYYGKQIGYDTTNGTLGSLTNEQVIPRIISVPTTGTDTNTLSVDILPNIATQANTTFSTLASLQSYIVALPQVLGSFTMDYYKIGRLGLMVDGEHLNTMGARLLASEVLLGMQGMNLFPHMRTNSQSWQYWDLQTLWSNLFTLSTGHWVPNYTTTPEYFAIPFYNSIWHELFGFIATWFNQAHIELHVQGKDSVQINPNDFIFVSVKNALPGIPIWIRWWRVGSAKPALGSAGTAQLNSVDATGQFSYLVRGNEFTGGVGNYNIEMVQLVGTYYDCSNRVVVNAVGAQTSPMINQGWARATMSGGTSLSSSAAIVAMTSLLASSSVGGITLNAGGLKVSTAGWYRVSANVLTAPGAGTVAGALTVNSATNYVWNIGRQQNSGSTTYRIGLSGTGLIRLSANDTVYVVVLSTGGGSVVDEGNNAWNNLVVEGPLEA